jgi:hypothetical protein
VIVRIIAALGLPRKGPESIGGAVGAGWNAPCSMAAPSPPGRTSMMKACNGLMITCALFAIGCVAEEPELASSQEQVGAPAARADLEVTGCPTTAPEIFGPVNIMYGPRPTFSWGAVPGASTYTLFVIDDANPSWWHRATGILGTSYTPGEDLPMDRPLRWKVKGEGDCTGPYASADFLFLQTPAPCPPVVAPVLTVSGPPGNPRPLFSWTPVPGATSYQLYVLRVPDETFPVPPVDVSATRHRYDEPLAHGTYRAVVRTHSPCGRGPSTASTYFTIDGSSCPHVGTPSAIAPYGLTTVRPTFTWNGVQGCTLYQLYVQLWDGSLLFGASSDKPILVLPFDLPPGAVLRWRVKCDDACGPGPYSPYTPILAQ